MHRHFIVVACAVACAAGSAFAEQETITEKAKDAAVTLGEKTREAMGKVKEMAQDTAQKSKAAAERMEARSGNAGTRSSKSGQMQDKADADFKAAKSRCDAIRMDVQKNVCEKQAAADHALAELRIAKAEAAAQGGKTSTMGAGKAAR